MKIVLEISIGTSGTAPTFYLHPAGLCICALAKMELAICILTNPFTLKTFPKKISKKNKKMRKHACLS